MLQTIFNKVANLSPFLIYLLLHKFSFHLFVCVVNSDHETYYFRSRSFDRENNNNNTWILNDPGKICGGTSTETLN